MSLAAPSTWQAWNDLQRAKLTTQLAQLRILRTLVDCAIQRVQFAQLESREWDYLKHQLRHVAPAMVAPQLLDALQKEQEWRAREAAGELDPDWDYEQMVGQHRRAAIAAATTQTEPALQLFAGSFE